MYVLSSISNTKEGTLNELAIANKIKKQLIDSTFIIPLHIDINLTYDNVNIELNRLNSINFKNSWADGLNDLVELLKEEKIFKTDNNYNIVNSLWQTVYIQNKHPLQNEELYYSNWFPIVEMPEFLRFHKFKYAVPKDFDLNSLPYPVIPFKDYIATFAYCYDFMEELPNTTTYNNNNTIELSIKGILDATDNSRLIQNREAKKIIVRLMCKSFDNSLQKKNISSYQMTNRTSFWIKKNILTNNKFDKVQLVGKQKEKNWHFGISGQAKLFPELCFAINSHIWFTSDGENLIESQSIQHSSRRKQGKNWWNNDWRDKILAFMKFLSDEENFIKLEVGSQEIIKVCTNPLMFKSNVSYIDPNIENLPNDELEFEAYHIDELSDESDNVEE